MYGLVKHSAFPFCERFLLYIFSSLMALFIPQMTDVLLFLTAESADERLEAEMNRVPSLDWRNCPLSRILAILSCDTGGSSSCEMVRIRDFLFIINRFDN